MSWQREPGHFLLHGKENKKRDIAFCGKLCYNKSILISEEIG